MPAKTLAQLVQALDLAPHTEGGYFRETFRAGQIVRTPRGERSLTTAIIYLVGEDEPSRFHRLAFDELWFFQGGGPLEMVFLDEGTRSARTVILGSEDPQALAPAKTWMAARVCSGGAYTLAGCVVTPGFEYEDFERGDKDALLQAFPTARDWIESLA